MKITITTPEIKDLEKRLAEETDRAEAWELRCSELEQELRDAQNRIHELDWTIAMYDQENRELKEELEKAKAEMDECRRDKNRLMDDCAKLRERLCKCGDTPFRDSLSDLAKRIHRIAVDHGWWETEDGKCDDGDRPFPEIVALCHSELSEALEEYRDDKPMAYQVQSYGIVEGRVENDPAKWFPASKPEGIAVEMLDCVIRIMDWMGHEGIDVDTLMEKKVKYNDGREHRHGGKKA